MGTKTPTVTLTNWPVRNAGWLWESPQAAQGIRLDSAAWWDWLAEPAVTRFAYPIFDPGRGYSTGCMTVRKEGRQRGGAYWTAYRRCGRQVRKIYIGRATAVTEARLQAIAWTFLVEERQRHGEGAPTVPSY
jgi:LuxR family maltose regulon positive regulatory protein